jgi:PAS domain S-box-containing protein
MRGKKRHEENGNQNRVLRDSAEVQLDRRSNVSLKHQGTGTEDIIHELQVHQVELEIQNEELRRVQGDLEASRARYFELYDMAPVGYCTITEQGLILEANLTAATMLGVARSALVKQPLTRFILSADRDIYYRHRKLLFKTAAPQACELRMVNKDGIQFWVHIRASVVQDHDSDAPVCRAVMSDETKHKQAEDRERLNHKVLDILNRSGVAPDTVHDILTTVKEITGFDAVGIRLREGEDFPYYVSKGFSDDFVVTERLLCARDPAGEIVRDAQGNAVLECMCGNILCGRTNPELPFFTEGGSFWSNGTTRLLASTTKADRLARTRNRCNRDGYESVALIPLRAGRDIIGLLQLNDHRPDRYTMEMILFFEGLGASIGIALARKQAADELCESEERFKTIFNAGPLGIAWIDSVTGHIRMANPMFAAIAGRTMEEITHIDWMSITHTDDVREIFDNIALLNTGAIERSRMQVRYLRPDGSIVWINMTITQLPVEDKLHPMHLSLIEDVTAHKQAETALRLSEENFHRTLDDSPLGVRIVSEEGEILYANRALLDIFGYETIEEMRDTSITKRYTESSYAEFQDRKEKRLLLADSSSDYEIEIVRKDGEVRQLQVWRKKVYWNGKEHYQVIYRNITDRKRAEEELRRTNAFLDSIIENIPDMLFLKDAKELRFVRINKAEEDLLGYSRDDLLGKNDYDFFPKEQADFFTEKDREALLGKKVVDIPEQPLQTRNKGDRILHTKKVPILNVNGEPEYLMGISEDITDRKRAEKILEETLDSLRKAVATTIQVMVSAVETRDPHTAGHQLRVADLARAIATEMKLPLARIDGIRIAGSIHDIGKLSIPAEILSRPTTLSKVEFSLIKEHPQRGYAILKDVESSSPLAEIVYQHHERMNGSGYPRNLKGDSILMEARILAVADVVEAIASYRPYRPALGINKALEEISINRDILYDSKVTDACLKLFQEQGYCFN